MLFLCFIRDTVLYSTIFPFLLLTSLDLQPCARYTVLPIMQEAGDGAFLVCDKCKGRDMGEE